MNCTMPLLSTVRRTNRLWHTLRYLSEGGCCSGCGSRRWKVTYNPSPEDTVSFVQGPGGIHNSKRFTARPPFNAEYRKRLKKRKESSQGAVEKVLHGDLERQHARLSGIADQRAMHAIQNIQRRSFLHFLHKTWPEFRWIMQPRHIVDAIICLHEVPEVPSRLREDPAFSDLLETFSSVLRYQRSVLGIADVVQSYTAITAHPVHSLPTKGSDVRRELLEVLNEKLLSLVHLEGSENYVNEKAVEQWLTPLKNRDFLQLVGCMHEPLFRHLHCYTNGSEDTHLVSERTLISVYQGMLLQLLRRRWYHRNDRAVAIIASVLFRLCYSEGGLAFPSDFLDRVGSSSNIISQVTASEDMRSYDPFVLSILADVLSRCGSKAKHQVDQNQHFAQVDSNSIKFMEQLLNELQRRHRIAKRRNVELLSPNYPSSWENGTSIGLNRGWTVEELVDYGRNTLQGAPARKQFDETQTSRVLRAFDRIESRTDLLELMLENPNANLHTR
eukprot:gb/GECG01001568.1/.p1 GENE.gb/GECG01001568.1/~~gb/GECG01001568.1/.p1  ORF type:complete len:499 (+),score=38.59 gb/GECG01001568.1/:1-1497(+)